MGYFEEREEEELNRRYPEGSREREVLDYSRGAKSHHQHEEVPKMLVTAFKVLMGISILMAVTTIIAYLNH